MKINIPTGKKVYFISDIHLGAPNPESSKKRELKVLRWLDKVKLDAAHIFLMGDIFDFWFEYGTVIPKGFSRLQGKLAELTDAGVPISIYVGNHDLWNFSYFKEEMNIDVYRSPFTLYLNDKKIYIAHGDGLGPGDSFFKFMKKLFTGKFSVWLFSWLHPDIGIRIAHKWSASNRIKAHKKDAKFFDAQEWLYIHSCGVESHTPHNYYLYGHRHLPLRMRVSDSAVYVNIGEWLQYDTYGVFDGDELKLMQFSDTNTPDTVFDVAKMLKQKFNAESSLVV